MPLEFPEVDLDFADQYQAVEVVEDKAVEAVKVMGPPPPPPPPVYDF